VVLVDVLVNALFDHEVSNELIGHVIWGVVRVGEVPLQFLLDIEVDFTFDKYFV
jgi:hypothetical protein